MDATDPPTLKRYNRPTLRFVSLPRTENQLSSSNSFKLFLGFFDGAGGVVAASMPSSFLAFGMGTRAPSCTFMFGVTELWGCDLTDEAKASTLPGKNSLVESPKVFRSSTLSSTGVPPLGNHE